MSRVQTTKEKNAAKWRRRLREEKKKHRRGKTIRRVVLAGMGVVGIIVAEKLGHGCDSIWVVVVVQGFFLDLIHSSMYGRVFTAIEMMIEDELA